MSLKLVHEKYILDILINELEKISLYMENKKHRNTPLFFNFFPKLHCFPIFNSHRVPLFKYVKIVLIMSHIILVVIHLIYVTMDNHIILVVIHLIYVTMDNIASLLVF